jgi:hypothetical protein
MDSRYDLVFERSPTMLKSIGLGIVCLTLGICGSTRAKAIPVDGGKYGDEKRLQAGKCSATIAPGNKDADENYQDLAVSDFAGLSGDGGHDFVSDICRFDLRGDVEQGGWDSSPANSWAWCESSSEGSSESIPWCSGNSNPKGSRNGTASETTAVPSVSAPTSAALGGVGVAGIMLMVRLRSRRWMGA